MTLVRERVRHLKVRVDLQLAADIEAYARRQNLSVSDAVRMLARQQLTSAENAVGDSTTLAATGFATLLVAEQTLKLLQQFLPDGERRALEAGIDAADAARDRLEQVEHLLALGEGK
jgi:hypothetical protein